MEIYTLGGVRILRGGQPTVGLNTRKTEALLIYLASMRQPQPRETLAGLFWAEHSQNQAMGSLRKSLSNLRQTVGECLTISRTSVTLNLDAPVWQDTTVLEDQLNELLKQGRLSSVSADQASNTLDLYKGEFLEGFSVFDSPEFEQWAASERERLHHLVVNSLSKLVAFESEQKAYQPGMAHAARLLALDPLNESAHRQMIRLLVSSGQRSAALNQYETCKKLLQEELGIEPDAETLSLYQQIRDGKVTADKSDPSFQIPDIPTAQIHNLPLQLTRFIGRETIIADVSRLLTTNRLVTLTGSGGVGKTRLALQVGAGLLPNFPNGVWLADLAPLSDPQHLISAVASVLNLRESSEKPLLNILLDYLKPKHLLLLMDNCEHLIAGCAEVADLILRSCPHIHLLATSREPLGIAGEMVIRVPSLSIPDLSVAPSLESLQCYESIQLFYERAQAVSPEFRITQTNAADLVQICQRLDGIPLALELAASRLRILSTSQIATRLDDRFRLLTGGSRRDLPRHQTLRALIDWSYELLSAPEQALFRCLSVFSGGWTFEAAQAVWGNDPTDLLTFLVDKSLVQVSPTEDASNRYRMLETIRQYAQAKLVEAQEAEDIRACHLNFFADFAEDCEPRIITGEKLVVYRRLQADLQNLRSALEWSLSSEDAQRIEKGMQLAGALLEFWNSNGNHREIITLLEEGLRHLDRIGVISPRTRAKADLTIGFLGLDTDDTDTIPYLMEGRALYPASEDLIVYVRTGILLYTWTLLQVDVGIEPTVLIEDCLKLARQTADRFLLANALYFHSNVQKDDESWERDLVDAARLFDELGNRWEAAWVRNKLGKRAAELGRYDQARAIFEESERLSDLGDQFGISLRKQNFGDLALREGNYMQMELFFQEANEADNKIGCNPFYNLNMLGYAVLLQGDTLRAAKIFKQCRPFIILKKKNYPKEHLVLDWAGLAMTSGKPEIVARCLGGLSEWLKSAPQVLKKFWIKDDQLYERCLSFCQEQLDREALKAAWQEGAAMTADQIIDEMEAIFLVNQG